MHSHITHIQKNSLTIKPKEGNSFSCCKYQLVSGSKIPFFQKTTSNISLHHIICCGIYGEYPTIKEEQDIDFLKKLIIFNTKKPSDHFSLHGRRKIHQATPTTREILITDSL